MIVNTGQKLHFFAAVVAKVIDELVFPVPPHRET